MSEKSHVGMLHRVCLVCLKTVETDILLDKRLKKSLNRDNYQLSDKLCEDCGKLEQEYIALVEVSNPPAGSASTLEQKDANRTGRIAHIRRTVFTQLFDKPCPTTPMVFVDSQLIDKLIEMQEKSQCQE